MKRATVAASALLLAASAPPVTAQVDPLMFLKSTRPNVMIMVDTSERMQRDAPSDPANPLATSSYYDPHVYARTAAAGESTLGVSTVATEYRRKYHALQWTAGADAGVVSSITAVADGILAAGDNLAAFNSFEAPTRLALARAAAHQAVRENATVARFGLYKMRQSAPAVPTGATSGNVNPVHDTSGSQQVLTDLAGSTAGRWTMSKATVATRNGTNAWPWPGSSSRLIAADDNDNGAILNILARNPRSVSTPVLVPAGQDDVNAVDAPVQYMLDDIRAEATRLALEDAAASECRNSVAVLITGGGEGNTTPDADPVRAARSLLLAIPGRRVPIVVVAIAPPSADVAQLQQVAAVSGGQYFEITKAQIDAAIVSPIQQGTGALAGTVVVPEILRAIQVGVQTAFQDFSDLNTKPFWTGPWKGWQGYGASPIIPSSEFQVTGPIVGSVNLENATDITGATLPLTRIEDASHNVVPQRSNLMITTGFTLPGFDGIVRGFRQYVPVADATAAFGYTFKSDGTPLWIASVPADPNLRNLYTAAADGSLIAFTTANVATLAPLMNLTVADAMAVITAIRAEPLGAIVDSIPAVMNAPSLNPPPDLDYRGFAAANTRRRTIIWVGTNRGILEGIDARLGVEVWGFIPLNLLPKLRTLRGGQSIGSFEFFADGSAKIADVKYDGRWHTHLVAGESAGGSFYQSFDVTMADQATRLGGAEPDRDATLADLLAYFSSPSAITLNWSFPSYGSFDPAVNYDPANRTFGDLKGSASAVEKSVGHSWSNPAIGQVLNGSGPYVVLLGSGFFPFSRQTQPNRSGAVAGTTFYVLNAKDGAVLASRDIGSDGVNETVDDCAAAWAGCTQMKNALQSDPVAAGTSSARFITKAYVGDLDGSVWRFNLTLDANSIPAIAATTKLFAAGGDQPIVTAMATVNVGGANQYIFFGTGGDRLPATDQRTSYHLLGILDNSVALPGSKVFDAVLTKTPGAAAAIDLDERVASFPAIAGDVVFFSTTTFKRESSCAMPDARLYAFTFTGGPAYDTTGDGKITIADKPSIATIAGARATAPTAVDQHLMFGAGGQVVVLGDSHDYNNGFGQAGVRVLSWREVR